MNAQSDADNNRDIESARAAAAKLNLADVLTETGQKQKRNLLAWAGVAIILGLYGVPLTHVPWLCLDIPPNRQSVAVAVVAAPLAYTFVGFVLYVLSDLKRWRLLDKADFLGIEGRTLFRLNENIWAVLSLLNDKTRPHHVTVDQAEPIVREALQQATDKIAVLKSIRAAALHLRWLQICIAYGWELGVPLLIGTLGLWLSLPPFLQTVAHWPWSETLRPP